MLNPLFAAFFAVNFAIPLAAQSPGFDCAKATTPQEKAICASPELSKADAEMTVAYRGLLSSVPPEVQAEIRANQRAWLRNRLSVCNPADATNFISCLLEAEDSRATALRDMVQHHDGITFIWRAIYLTAPDSPEVVETMKERGGETSGYVNVTWPQAQSTAPEWVAWNKAIAEAAGPGNAQGGSKPRTRWAASDAVDQDADVTIALNSVSGTLVSASIAGMTYGHGAAHPNHGVTQLNWMLKEKRPLQSSDIFRPQIYWSNELYNRVNQYLHKTLDADGESYDNWVNDPKGMQKTVRGIAAEPSRWQIDDKGVTIVFNPYEVACYACTPQPFTMSWESLKPLLNPVFVIPTATK
jgi:uncharacterized protein YecT (DUF1311 family)